MNTLCKKCQERLAAFAALGVADSFVDRLVEDLGLEDPAMEEDDSEDSKSDKCSQDKPTVSSSSQTSQQTQEH